MKMADIRAFAGAFLAFLLAIPAFAHDTSNSITVALTEDFAINGRGTSSAWQQAEWIELTKRTDFGSNYRTRCKLLHSTTGLYVLFDCEDTHLTSTLREDFSDLFREDVVELFIWPDEASVIYFEYELSPANYELVLLVPNYEGDFHGWRPWRYEGDRKTRHATNTTKADGSVTFWTAEFFIPYVLLKPLQNVPPMPGTSWRINLYRADFDSGKRAIWSWQPFDKRFHDYNNFGYLYFEEPQAQQ